MTKCIAKKIEVPADFIDCFDRMVAIWAYSTYDQEHWALKCEEYYDELKGFSVYIINQARLELRRLKKDKAFPSLTEIRSKCEEIQNPQKSAVELQAEIEEKGRQSWEDYQQTWDRIQRFNKWEVSQMREQALAELEKMDPKRDAWPEIFIKQRMVKIYRERNGR